MVDLVANTEYTRIADVVAAMQATFAHRRAQAPEAQAVQVQDKFIAFDLYPAFGWKLVHAGVAQALANDDAECLHDMLTKFVALTFRHDDRFDAQGLQVSSGTDYCVFVNLAIYAMALGQGDAVARWFHAERPLSRHGYAAFRHAADSVGFANPAFGQHFP